jgi:hypothetical protein
MKISCHFLIYFKHEIFFPQFCDVTTLAIAQEEFGKFGYMSKRKVKKLKNPTMVWCDLLELIV